MITGHRSPFRPGFLREQLTRYAGLFPHNTLFLSLLAWKETRLGIDDKVRSVLDATAGLAGTPSRLSSRAFAVRHEARTGNANSTRAAFERALDDDDNDGGGGACGNHPGLWVSYIRFLGRHGGGGSGSGSGGRGAPRAKAKDAFYRAVQHCPWSKEVFMEAFATLGRDMDSAELDSVYDTLCDKGLRVHVEMPEFVERWRREQKKER